MKSINPMELLRRRAEETLSETTRQLGDVQQTWQSAVAQQQQLQHYEQEYQQALRQGMTAKGMCVADLVNQQAFILSLGQVVKQQEKHVSRCAEAVIQARKVWVKDKQRLNAFETLIVRREAAEMMRKSRQEQKIMDEFAQRAARKREQ